MKKTVPCSLVHNQRVPQGLGYNRGSKKHAMQISVTTIIRLRRLYFMAHGLGGIGAGAEELGSLASNRQSPEGIACLYLL